MNLPVQIIRIIQLFFVLALSQNNISQKEKALQGSIRKSFNRVGKSFN
jgi:hypothetical protein